MHLGLICQVAVLEEPVPGWTPIAQAPRIIELQSKAWPFRHRSHRLAKQGNGSMSRNPYLHKCVHER